MTAPEQEPERQQESGVIIFEAHDDSSYTHECGVVVQVPFGGSGVSFKCPRCKKVT